MVTVAVLSKLNQRSQEHLQEYTCTLLARLEEVGVHKTEAARIVGNPPALVFVPGDFENKRRSRAAIPYYERCSGRKADGEQCTRRRKEDSDFCGTHIKGTPYGKLQANSIDVPLIKQKNIWVEDIKGINYFIDDDGNVYNHEDVLSNKLNPIVIAKYTKNSVTSVYNIPEFGI